MRNLVRGQPNSYNVSASCRGDLTTFEKTKAKENIKMKQINVGIIGTGWCGGIRANTCAASALVAELHIAEINEERLKEIGSQTEPTSASTDYQDIITNESLDTIIISATPETTHYPMAKEALLAGKHVFLEKPLALALEEADELIKIQ